MSPKQSRPSEQQSLAAEVIEPADQPFVDAARALLKADFLFSNHPQRPYFAYDLTTAQVDVLAALARAEGASLNCSEIAEKTLITKGGITGIVDRLEARGFVRRVHSREDRRSVEIQLSAKGIEFFRKVYPQLARHNRTLFEKAFSRAQVKDFNDLLTQLIRTLENG
jgi:MarR family 2-MHQ and catechol resistance regulon transcriptional repressor